MRSTVVEVQTGRHVDLVPVALVARQHLYEIACLPSVAAGWRTDGRLVELAAFDHLVAGPLSWGIVERSTGFVAGHVGVHDLDERAGTGVASMFVDPRLPLAPLLAGEAFATFVDLVFGTGGLAKLTVEVGPEHARLLTRAAVRRPGITHEGTRRRHRRIGQELVDVALFAVWPEVRDHAERSPASPPADLLALLADLSPQPLDPAHLAGHDRLVEDLGLDSLALVELLAALHDRRGEPVVLDHVDGPLTVDALRAALG